MFPIISAVGAKRRPTLGSVFMQVHVGHLGAKGKHEPNDFVSRPRGRFAGSANAAGWQFS
jgi:hypothetical protein